MPLSSPSDPINDRRRAFREIARTGERRREELADFLRHRREALAPEDVGLPNGGRRRTPGLRREEVAQLAGIGATWYTWLEQGRDVRASLDVLEALARALGLNQAERSHLIMLGRGDYEIEDWDVAVAEAQGRIAARDPDYMIGDAAGMAGEHANGVALDAVRHRAPLRGERVISS